ncbi:hypothetical protein [Pantoea vagans]|uniref:hypothetical protein n=1 Tax=Pantoea vagans TaxID=470934 RepID=UPI0028A6786E|nr:hypothetical protein [Pantoea vagans]
MNKLTAEKCREQIAEWEMMMKDWDLSIASFKHLQAYRIALPILEQQERGEGDWIEWGGGERPVAKVEVKYRNGQLRNENAGCLRWYHLQNDFDIIAYRIISERATNQNGEQ